MLYTFNPTNICAVCLSPSPLTFFSRCSKHLCAITHNVTGHVSRCLCDMRCHVAVHRCKFAIDLRVRAVCACASYYHPFRPPKFSSTYRCDYNPSHHYVDVLLTTHLFIVRLTLEIFETIITSRPMIPGARYWERMPRATTSPDDSCHWHHSDH